MVVAGGEKGIKGWTSDAGRGRVLQTGQSLLATALDGASEVREILASILISLTSPKTGGVRPIQCIPQIQVMQPTFSGSGRALLQARLSAWMLSSLVG